MIYFSGFGFADEEGLFEPYLDHGEYMVAGFSFGAQKAFEYAINSNKRIDLLQLFSPAYFNGVDEKFIRLQLLGYTKNQHAYEEQFYKNVQYPSHHDISSYLTQTTIEDLSSLLNYQWDKNKFESLDFDIEIYLGIDDKIVDFASAKEFFEPLGKMFVFNRAGHILKGE